MVGIIVAFLYLSGPTVRKREHSLLSAPTKAPEANAIGLGCLCSWFSVKGRVLQPMAMDMHGYYSLEFYLCTLPRPQYKDQKVLLSCSVSEIPKKKT